MAERIATILGGGGFIGRPVVEGLVRAGYTVRVGSRRPDRLGKLRRLGGGNRVIPVYAALDDRLTLIQALSGAELAINMISILAETAGQTLEGVNTEGAGRVARLAAQEGVARYVQVSAIGASPASPSRYGRSKGQGEALVRQAMPNAAIIRPSVVFGPEDRFLNTFATMARFMPVIPVFSPDAVFQPVYVGDVAAAIVALGNTPQVRPTTIEAGGPEQKTMRGLIESVLHWTDRRRRLVPMPAPVAWLEAALFERLPGQLITRDQLRMMQVPNVVAPDADTLLDLGIFPASLESVAPRYLHP